MRITRTFSCGSYGPTPTYIRLAGVLEDIEHELRGRGLKPTAAYCTSWRLPFTQRMIAKIAITAEPGGMDRSLRSWFAWQHPRWQWAGGDVPEVAA